MDFASLSDNPPDSNLLESSTELQCTIAEKNTKSFSLTETTKPGITCNLKRK